MMKASGKHSCSRCHEGKRRCDYRGGPGSCSRCKRMKVECTPHVRIPNVRKRPAKRPRTSSGHTTTATTTVTANKNTTTKKTATATARATRRPATRQLGVSSSVQSGAAQTVLDADTIKKVNSSITKALRAIGDRRIIDTAKLRSLSTALASWDRMAGRDCMPDVRAVLTSAIESWGSDDVVNDETAMCVDDDGDGGHDDAVMATIKDLQDQGGCYIKVTTSSDEDDASPHVAASERMSEEFLSSTDLQTFMGDSHLACIYALAMFLDESSITSFYEAVARVLVERMATGPIDTPVMCRNKSGDSIPCLASLAYQHQTATRSGILVIRLLPQVIPGAHTHTRVRDTRAHTRAQTRGKTQTQTQALTTSCVLSRSSSSSSSSVTAPASPCGSVSSSSSTSSFESLPELEAAVSEAAAEPTLHTDKNHVHADTHAESHTARTTEAPPFLLIHHDRWVHDNNHGGNGALLSPSQILDMFSADDFGMLMPLETVHTPPFVPVTPVGSTTTHSHDHAHVRVDDKAGVREEECGRVKRGVGGSANVITITTTSNTTMYGADVCGAGYGCGGSNGNIHLKPWWSQLMLDVDVSCPTTAAPILMPTDLMAISES